MKGKAVKGKADIHGEKQSRDKDLLWQKRVYKKDDMREFFKLCGMLDRACSTKPKPADGACGAGGCGTGGGGAAQRCVVKCRIGKDMAAHRKFLNEYMPQKNKAGVEEKPELFGGGFDGDCLGEYERRMTGRHFKFVISPENGHVDVEALVRALVKRMERALGRKFSWLAAAHKDTARKHAHLLVNGVDKAGEEITLSRAFIKRTMREMARRICTEMVGERSKAEMAAERSGLYKRKGYSALDGALQAYERGLSVRSDRYGSEIKAPSDGELRKRLEYLAGLGLAEMKGGSKDTYMLEKGWEETLRGIGRYNSFLKARAEIGGGRLELYGRNSGPVSGKVRKAYVMNDEENWNHAVVIENEREGKAWYVPLYYEPDRRLLNKEVRCEMKENQRGLLTPAIRTAGDGWRGR
jgi:hypothetical protein